MSATNHTTTIGLSQYISTDKPTYLTDYNGDMLAIDNAIASDRDGISTAQNKANTADGKADTNKTSIDTLNAQINGNPEDPSDTGLAGKVTDNSGDIDTIEALIGNGTPTTSNQTIIGAINGLEGAIAPREDGADLANSYAIGEQFARGGSVYTALTALTAGTAFASLTLNTDYKTSDTLVEQFSDVVSDIQTISNYPLIKTLRQKFVSVTGDGVKTFATLMEELNTAYGTAMENLDGSGVIMKSLITGVTAISTDLRTDSVDSKGSGRTIYKLFTGMTTNGTILNVYECQHNLAGWRLTAVTLSDNAANVLVDYANEIVSDGAEIALYCDIIA